MPVMSADLQYSTCLFFPPSWSWSLIRIIWNNGIIINHIIFYNFLVWLSLFFIKFFNIITVLTANFFFINTTTPVSHTRLHHQIQHDYNQILPNLVQTFVIIVLHFPNLYHHHHHHYLHHQNHYYNHHQHYHQYNHCNSWIIIILIIIINFIFIIISINKLIINIIIIIIMMVEVSFLEGVQDGRA